jgi:hypothetical protein
MVQIILPLACSWAERQQAAILRDGVALTASQISDARRIGILYPERIRLRVVDRVPMPLHSLLRRMAERAGLISAHTSGMSFLYGIYIRSDCWGERRLVVHEMVHTAQYERLGGFRPFLKAYLHECVAPPGYPFGPLEQEAERIADEICG